MAFWMFTQHYAGPIGGRDARIRAGTVVELSAEDEARIKREQPGALFPAEDPNKPLDPNDRD